MNTATTLKEFTILLVDDREENLISLEEILETDNRTFLKASSGNEALRYALKNDKIGLIMLDVQMPEMDGFEVARLLKSNPKTKDISIIFVTAISKEEQYVIKGFEEGAVDYLQKPLDINVTKAKVAVFERLYFSQQELKKTAAELDSINKQLERFVYMVAHDLKSPLTGIIALLSLLKMNVEDRVVEQEEVKDYVDQLSAASFHLSDMITAILDYSRKSIEQQKVEEVDVYDLLQQTTQLMFPPKHIHIRINKPMPVLETKKLKLQQVFQNLISNAIKYNDKPTGEIELGCDDKGTHYEFYVRDNGPGIAEEDQQHIFGLFQVADHTTKADSSTGVGLNILKILVEEQGGKIRVESTPGVGSTFFFDWKK
ncbi:sensor histidine kinase [Tellurirhabdus bombi]|uniref:sensor histidine kinase n=1 Tax=Tellurirhabdus bombi TaxID=2907205 RepID=UPI001F380A95|nr:hybrid sensor histidine kinase/response regulator [Tellurirhabdus bombi]